MRKVKIITDSGCDVSREDELRYKIDILPFEIVLGEEVITERVTMSNDQFLEEIEKSEFLPKTSQITMIRFEEKFLECVEKGYDDVIVVLINSTGSATYSNAVNVEHQLREEKKLGKTKFHIVDSHCYSIGYGYAVVEGARKLEAGMGVDIVLGFMEDWFNCCEIYIVGFNLRHMKKSGRISAAAAFLGEMLQLKPVISLIDGKSEVVKKSRGDRKALEDAVAYISGRMIPETPWHILTSTAPDLESAFQKMMNKKVGYEETLNERTGCVVASNAGTKFIGVVIKGMPRR